MIKLPVQPFARATMVFPRQGQNSLQDLSLFKKKKIESTATRISSIAGYYGVNGKQLISPYTAFISPYREWEQLGDASAYVLSKRNLGPSLCIDESSRLSTVVTDREGHGCKGTLVSMIRGAESEDVIKMLEKIHIFKRKPVKEVTFREYSIF